MSTNPMYRSHGSNALSDGVSNDRFVDYVTREHESLAKAKSASKQMMTDFGEQSRYKDFRRKLAHENPESVIPTGFLCSDRTPARRAESRNLQIWKLRRLEKKRLWFQDIVIAFQGFFYSWQRLNPLKKFGSFDDQVRRSVRKPAKPAMNMAPLSRAVRMRQKQKPLAGRLRAS